MAPTSQNSAERPISFVLQRESGTITHVPLVLRPEDLTKNDPALLTVTPTFGGAWADDFGPGVSTIQISGHTGWGAGGRPDGVASFLTLYDSVWKQFHADRQTAVSKGKNPDVMKLIFADALDSIVAAIYPGAFTLRRSKSRPLLMMYQISMTVLTDRLDPPLLDQLHLNAQGQSTDQVVAGFSSLSSSIAKIQAAQAKLGDFINSTIVAPVNSLVGLTTTAMNKVLAVVDPIKGVVTAEAAQVVGIATSLAQVGRNVFNAYNAVAGLPDFLAREVSQIAGAYENAFCVLKNAFKVQRQYTDYSDLYGASTCSSTVGGSPISPLANQNPFETVITPPSTAIAVSPAAQVSMATLMAVDPVLYPPTMPTIGSLAASVASGVKVA